MATDVAFQLGSFAGAAATGAALGALIDEADRPEGAVQGAALVTSLWLAQNVVWTQWRARRYVLVAAGVLGIAAVMSTPRLVRSL